MNADHHKKIPLGQVIARRTMKTTGERRVRVSVGMPVFVGDGWDWVCPYRIVGIGTPLVGHVHGVDALQALQLVSAGIRTSLEETGRALSWVGDRYWQCGFPQQLGGLGIPPLERHLSKLVTKETTKWTADRREMRAEALRRQRERTAQ